MQFIPTDDYREVSMYAGLNAIEQETQINCILTDQMQMSTSMLILSKDFAMKMDVSSVEHMTRQWIHYMLSNGAFIISFM